MLKAGVARAEISPEQGIELAGYPHYPRNNTGVHDPLFAACLYLNNGKKEIALVTLDLLFFSKKHVASVREAAEKQCGIAGKNIMICCSHTHSGPWAAGRLDIESLAAGKEQPKGYVETLIEKVISGIVQAKQNSFEARIAVGTAVCGAEQGIGGNRRMPGGPHDPLISVISVKDTNDVVRGVFVNYTLHPTFIHENSNAVSADYPHYLKEEINEHAKQAVVGFSQGASGNQSSRYYRQGESFDEAERVGRTLGRAAYGVVKNADYKSEIRLETASLEMEVELRTFSSEEELEKRVARDEACFKELDAKGFGKSGNREAYYLWQNANLKLLGSEDQLGYVRMIKKGVKIELLEDENPFEIQIIRLGDACIVGVPGEHFVEYALYIKAMAGFETVIFHELANGCLPGYVYTPESLKTGGYETDTSMLGEDFGRHVVDRVLACIEKVK